MDFVTQLPQALLWHDAVWVIVDRLTKSTKFLGCADDLHPGGILQVIHTDDYQVAWSVSIHSIKSGSQVYGSFLEEFPKESWGHS